MLSPERAHDLLILLVVVAAFLVLKLRTKRLARNLEALRTTMNEAIIHDLKNPLTSVMGCISYLLTDGVDDKQREKLLGIAMHSCRAQLSLIETLVDTGRLETGELLPRRENTDPRALLKGCLDSVRGTAKHLGVKLVDRVAGVLPERVALDADLIQRSLFNLLNNALKYTPPGGTVTLTGSFSDGALRVSVADTGIGIGKDHIGRLFQKYYRIEGGDQTSRRGTGLGLYFCRMVVEAHGGKISVVSEPGRGAAIAFSIPHSGTQGAPSHEPQKSPETART